MWLPPTSLSSLVSDGEANAIELVPELAAMAAMAAAVSTMLKVIHRRQRTTRSSR
jgi:hypothetical protein